jgi:hypothetical protein
MYNKVLLLSISILLIFSVDKIFNLFFPKNTCPLGYSGISGLSEMYNLNFAITKQWQNTPKTLHGKAKNSLFSHMYIRMCHTQISQDSFFQVNMESVSFG